MSRRNRDGMPMGVLVVLVALAAVLCIVMGTLMYLDNRGLLGGDDEGQKMTQQDAASPEATEKTNEENGNTDVTGTFETNRQEIDESFFDDLLPKDKNVNIRELQQTVNPDIYAWLYIPDAGIDEPVLQNAEDAFYYTDHNSKGEADENGALYTQMMNKKDFSDNVTVIYGHNYAEGNGFSKLKVFADPDYFSNYPYIYVYTENAVLLYQTFAAYESDDKHIPMFYGTADDGMYSVYLSRLKEIAGVNSNLNTEYWPETYDKILTLSTGVTGKEDRRYLVQAKLLGGYLENEDQN